MSVEQEVGLLEFRRDARTDAGVLTQLIDQGGFRQKQIDVIQVSSFEPWAFLFDGKRQLLYMGNKAFQSICIYAQEHSDE